MPDDAMKAGDFKPCALCGKGMMHTGLPLFWRVRIERMSIDSRAVQRAHGMEQYMDGVIALARVFEDPDIATPIAGQTTALVCETCALQPHMLATLAESAADQQKGRV